MMKYVNVIVCLLALASLLALANRTHSDIAVSKASASRGMQRVYSVGGVGTLEGKYIAAGYMAQEALMDLELSDKERCVIILASYRTLKEINSYAPGYRKTRKLFEELCKVVR